MGWKVDGNSGGELWDNRRLIIPEQRGGADENKKYWRWFSAGLEEGPNWINRTDTGGSGGGRRHES